MTSLSTPRPRHRHDAIEVLEARIAPATIVSLDSTTHLLTVLGDHVDDGSSTVQVGAPETLSFAISGAFLTITDPTHGVTTMSSGVSQAGPHQVNIPIASLTGDFTIDTGTGADTLSFAGSLALAADKNLTAHTTGTISFAPTAALSAKGTGTLSFTTDSDISIPAGAQLSVVNGSLDLTANGTLSGTYTGISVGGTLSSTGSGTISLNGTGGDTASKNYGLDLHGQISTTGTGALLLFGAGGLGTDANSGIVASGGTISAGTGGIIFAGAPGGDAGASYGIDLKTAITSRGDVQFLTDKGLFFEPGAAVNAGSAVVTLDAATPGTPISLGTFQQAAFGVTDAMLGVITASTVFIGDTQAGAITIDAAIHSSSSLDLASGSTLTGPVAGTLTVGKDLSIETGGLINLAGVVTVPGVLSLTGVEGDIGMSLLNAANDLHTVHVFKGTAVQLRDADGFSFDAQASTLLSLESAGTLTQLGAITGGGDLLKLGTGTLELSQANAIGKTTIAVGTIVFSNPGAFGTGTITLGDAGSGSTDVSLIAGGAIPSGSFVNQIVVPSILGGGVVKIGSAVAPGAVHYQGAMTLNRATTFESANTGGTFYEGAISGNLGTLTIEGGGRSAFRLATNSFTGDVKLIGASTLELLSPTDEIPDSSNVFIEQGSFLLLSKPLNLGVETIANLTGDGTVSTSSTSTTPQTLSITAATGTSFQFDGFITDGAAPFSLIKTGAGTATLTNELTYSGATVVKAGTLKLANTDFDNPIAQSAVIDLRSGATLDVTGLTPGNDPKTLALSATQTLSGNGTLLGNVAGGGTIAPGDVNGPGILTINGNFNPSGSVKFRVKDPYTVAGSEYDQLVVSGAVDLSAATLRFSGGGVGAPAAGQMVKLISNTGSGATVPATGLPEGSILFAGNAPFTIAYNAGAGHDVVLTTAVGQVSLGATLVGGQLIISDTSANGRPSHTSVLVELPGPGFPGQLVVNDDLDFFAAAPAGGTLGNSNHGFSLPFGKVTKGVVINAGGGDDVLILDLTTGGKLPTGGVTFNGGSQSTPSGDQLMIEGGTQGVVTYTFPASDSGAGGIAMSALGTVSYTGAESLSNTGFATNAIFNLPSGKPNSPTLANDGQGDGLTRLSASNLPRTDFLPPSGTATINRNSSADILHLGDLSGFDGSLSLGSPAKPFDTIFVNTSLDFGQALNLSTNNFSLEGSLSVSASAGTLSLGAGMINGTIGGGLGLVKTAGAVAGATLTLAGVNTYTGETFLPSGPLVLANALAAENSTISVGSAFALHFASGIGTFTVGGLAGTGALALTDDGGAPVTLQAGQNDSTYAGALSGSGNLHKTGTGTLTLTGKNTHVATFLDAGILQINSDLALGAAGAPLNADGGTLQAVATTTVARNIVLLGATTFEASAGKTLTLSGVISGAGDLLIGDLGTVLVTGQSNTNSGGVELGGGASQVVNGVTISSPGIKSGIMVTPGSTPGEVAQIDLTGVNVPVSLVIKSPKTGTVTVDKIVSNDNTAIKMISLGANVKLGDGVADSTPDLVVNGKLTTLVTGDVNAHTIIQLGKGLAYLATYKNAPNVTLHDVLGAGVVIDVAGDGVSGLLGGIGGGGLGKIVVNKWAAPGLIKTTQSITSFTVKSGDSHVSIEVDPHHLGTLTTGNVGLVSIPAGQWAGADMQVEGVVAQFLTKGIAAGSTITAGAFGTVNIKGNYAGSILATYDPTVGTPLPGNKLKVTATGAIGSVTISTGDFTGVVSGDGKVGNITLSGTARFMGTLRGGSLGNITAASFTGTGAVLGDPRHTITAIGSIGNIIAKTGGLTDYIIAAGTDLGSDALFGGVADTFHSFYLTATSVKTAVSIGTVTIKGVVQGTTIAAGVDPGADGVYGDVNDLVMAPPPGFTGKTKIGALTFDTNLGSALAFSDTAPPNVSNAFEAQVLTSVKFGTGAAAPTNPQFRKDFTNPTYIDSGGSSIIVRLLS